MKKKIAVMFMVLVMALTCLACFTACSNDDSKTLVVGITDYEPMDYQDKDGKWIGFDADLANAFGQEYGYEKVEFIEIDWDNKVVEINSGNIDLIWNGMTADEELGTQIDFSVAYATNMQCAVVRKDSVAALNTVDAIKAAKVAVENGSAGNNVSNEALGIDNKDLILAGNQVGALLEVKAKTSDVAIVDYTMAYSIVGKNDYADLVIVDTDAVSFNKEVFAVGVKKGNTDMQTKLNDFFKKKYADGTLDTLAAKYSVGLNKTALDELK